MIYLCFATNNLIAGCVLTVLIIIEPANSQIVIEKIHQRWDICWLQNTDLLLHINYQLLGELF